MVINLILFSYYKFEYDCYFIIISNYSLASPMLTTIPLPHQLCSPIKVMRITKLAQHSHQMMTVRLPFVTVNIESALLFVRCTNFYSLDL